ncbi:MAG: hypothetical protein R3E40_05515 [Rhodocyclaceae bacterium]
MKKINRATAQDAIECPSSRSRRCTRTTADELDSYLSAKKEALKRLQSSLVVRDQMRESAFAEVQYV